MNIDITLETHPEDVLRILTSHQRALRNRPQTLAFFPRKNPHIFPIMPTDLRECGTFSANFRAVYVSQILTQQKKDMLCAEDARAPMLWEKLDGWIRYCSEICEEQMREVACARYGILIDTVPEVGIYANWKVGVRMSKYAYG